MKIELPLDRVTTPEIERHVVARRINETGAHPVFRIIHLRAVQLRRHNGVVAIRPKRAAGEFATSPEIPLVVRRINHARLREHPDDFPLIVRFPDQTAKWNHRETSAEKGRVRAHEHIQMVFLKDEDAAESDRHVERGGVEIVLRVDARLDLDEGADVVVVHVIDADSGRDALKVIGHGSARAAEIESIVADAQMEIEMAAEEKSVAVAE